MGSLALVPAQRRFLLFVLTSGAAAAVNVVSCYLLSELMPYLAAVAVAYLIGMITAFILARTFVFDAGERHAGGQFGRFTLVNAIAFVQVWLVSVALAEMLFPAVGFSWHAHAVAHVIGVASPILTSYLLHKNFSFRD